MSAHSQGVPGTGWVSDHERRLSVLRWILGFGIVSTGLHFTHNFVAIDQYPDDLVSGTVVQVAILLFWPLFTGLALYAYRLYAQAPLPRGAPAPAGLLLLRPHDAGPLPGRLARHRPVLVRDDLHRRARRPRGARVHDLVDAVAWSRACA